MDSLPQGNRAHSIITILLSIIVILLVICVVRQNRPLDSTPVTQESTALQQKIDTLQQRLTALEVKSSSEPTPATNTQTPSQPRSTDKNFKRKSIEFNYPSSWSLEIADISHDGEFPPDQWDIKNGSIKIGNIVCPSFALGAPRERSFSVNKEFQKNQKTFHAEFTILNPLSGNGSTSDPWTSFIEVAEKVTGDAYANDSCIIYTNTPAAPNQELKDGFQKIYETLR